MLRRIVGQIRLKSYSYSNKNERVNKIYINYSSLVNDFNLFKEIFNKQVSYGNTYNILFTTIFNSLNQDFKQPLFRNSYVSFYLHEKLNVGYNKDGLFKLVQFYRRWALPVRDDQNLFLLMDHVLKGNDIDYDYYIPILINTLEDKVLDRIRMRIISKVEYLLDYYDFELGQPLALIIYFYKNEKVEEKDWNSYKSPSVLKIMSSSLLKKVTSFGFLPLSMDLNLYGKMVKNKSFILNKIKLSYLNNNNNRDLTLMINMINSLTENNVLIFEYNYNYKNKKLILVIKADHNYIWVFNKQNLLLDFACIDQKLSDNYFKRVVEDKLFFISDLKVQYFMSKVKVESLSLPQNSGLIDKNFVNIGTLDLECFNKVGNQYKDNFVYSIGFSVFKKDSKRNLNFNDLIFKIYYLDDYKDFDYPSVKMVIDCLKYMLINYNNYTFYVHNLGGYDSIYLLNIIIKYNKFAGDERDHIKFDLIYRDANILKIRLGFKFNQKIYYINICDSLALLNMSLNNLCKTFNIPSKISKSVFPYNFVNFDNLNYVGNIPSFEFFEGISLQEYYNLTNYFENNQKLWSLREEVQKYLIKDLGSLLLVMEKFRIFIYKVFNMDLRKNLTISRLALNIFDQKYHGLSNIPQIINDRLYSFIREGLYGGVTSVYIPYGENLYYYDVNSLYPAMALDNYIGGLDIQFVYNYNEEGLNLDQLFGFFKAEVETPIYEESTIGKESVKIGLLPLRTKDKGLIFPLGKFQGVWFSEELKFAKKNGYNIKVIEGYNFNKIESPFKKYILDLFKLKSNNKGGGKFIYKSLLNNLIGRFGIDIRKAVTKLLNKKNFDLVMACCEVISVMPIDDKELNYIVKYIPVPVPEKCAANNIDYLEVMNNASRLIFTNNDKSFYNDASVMVTAMINSYARIWLNNFKLDLLNNGYKIYYCDTDSIVVNKPIDPKFVGENIGDFKLVAKILRGYFVSNKLYMMVDQFNNNIIRSKGINSSLSEKQFISLLNNVSIHSNTKISMKNVYEGNVYIENRSLILNYDSFKKRNKIYDNKGRWIDTKPLIINHFNR